MSLHVLFIGFDGSLLSDVTSNFLSVSVPSNAFVMRVCDNEKSYSNSSLTKLFDVTNLQYSTVFSYTIKGDYSAIDVLVSDFQGFTVSFNQLSAQFIGNNPMSDIYDFSAYSSGSSIDFSTIVTALNGISTALSALTNLSNLSNLADLASIITAIQNKDNQSDICNNLVKLFSYRLQSDHSRRSVFLGYNIDLEQSQVSNFGTHLNNIRNCFLIDNQSASNSPYLYQKLFSRFLSLCSIAGNSGSTVQSFVNNSSLKDIVSALENIETKLEQNLPFSVLVQNDVVLANPNETYRYIKDFEKIGFN